MVFENKDRNYPICGVQDNIPGVCYRKTPKSWMNSKNMLALLKESRALKPLPQNQFRTIYIDNFSSQNMTEDIFDAA